jgi:hypothetical protein
VPEKGAILKLVEGWKKRQRGRNLAAESRQKQKDGSQRKFATVHRGTTHCAKMAWRKRNAGKHQTRDSMVQGTSKGQMLRRREQTQQQCNKGIRKRDLKER